MAAVLSNMAPSENWDDDFEFQQSTNTNTKSNDKGPRMSSTSSRVTEDWDVETSAHEQRRANMAAWVEEAGPSTPTRRLVSSGSAAENWDDDFEDRLDSPRRSERKSPTATRTTTTTTITTATENWDDEFQFGDSPAKSKHAQYLSHEQDEDSEDDYADFNALDKDEDDRTVTARTRRGGLARLAFDSAPAVPPLPLSTRHPNFSDHVEQPFPRSPTTSSRDRDSIAAPSYYSYNSTTHLRGLGNLPPSPPIHKERERRRLRKKSRPQAPQGLDAMNVSRESVISDEAGGLSRPVTPLRSRSSLRSPSLERNKRDSVLSSNTNGSGLPSSPPPKTPLLSRIGSVKKKWPVRKKRASSTPSEVEMQRGVEDSSKLNWFFLPTSANASASASASSKVDGNSQAFDDKYDAHQTPKASRTTNPSHQIIPGVPPLLPPFNTHSNSSHDSSNAMPPTTPSTPSKLMKRKSFGFVQLKPRNKSINDLNNVQANPSPSPHSPTSHPPHLPPRNPARPNTKRHSVSANPSSMASCSTSDLPSDLEAELHGNASASGSNASGSNCNASLNSSSVDLNAGNRESVLRPSQSRHGSYGGLGLGRAPQGSSDNIDGSRRRSFSKSSRKRSKSRDKRTTTTPTTITTTDSTPHTEPGQDKEPGGRSFMGSVRRISFIGKPKQQERKEHKHKRTKSGVSLASVGDGSRKSFERTRTSGIEGNTTDTGEGEAKYANLAPPIPPLLPPIELSPPSPPRLGDPSPSLASASAAAYSVQSTFNKSPSLTNPKPTKAVSPKAVSPLTASLGRSTGVPSIGMGGKSITSSTSMPATSTSANVPRRNSLGDLKIPARISQAQVGLRRDLGMVKEFAGRVEQLKNLQTAYHNLLVEVQSILDAQHAQYAVQAQSQSRGASPLSGTSSSLGGSSSSPSSPSALNVMNPMNIFRPLSRIRSNTSSTIISPSSSADSTSAAATFHVSPTSLTGSSSHPEKPESTFPHPHSEVSPVSLQSSFPHPDTYKHLAAAFYTINSRYKIAWECAELLIELGGGPASATEEGTGSSPGVINESVHPSSVGGNVFHGRPSTSTSAPTALGSVGSSQAKKSRERAITLSGDESSSSKPGTPTPDAGLPTYFSPLSGPTSGSASITANTSTFNSAPASVPNMAWRASTGRHDLNQRQLLLLREMLNNPDSTFVSESVPPGQQPLQSPLSSHRTQFDDSHYAKHPNHITHNYSQHSSRGQSGQNSPMSSPMLTTSSALPTATDEVNREWRWGEGMNSSTITLPSEESSVPSGFGLDRLGAGGTSSNPDDPHGNKKNRKTSRSSRLRGMSGLRDMLRSLTRNQNHQSNLMNASTMVPPSTTSLGTEESSIEYHHRYIHAKVPGAGAGESSAYTTQGRRRAKTSSGPDAGSSIRDRDQERSTSPYPNTHIRPISPFTASSLSVKASPRRPSLASIFRLGSRESKEGREGRDKKEKLFSSPSSPDVPGGVGDVMHTKERSGKTSGTSDEDWDRLELEYPQRRRLEKKGNNTDPSSDTIRGRSPYMQQDVALPPVPPIPSSASQTSLPIVSPGPSGVPGVPARATRLSNVEENEHPELALDDPSASMNSLSNRGSSPVPYRKNLKKNLTGSVRSMPAQPLSVDHLAHSNYHSRHSYVPHSAQTSLNDNNVAKQMKLAMTPENIKPLLENAKEVHARLTDCIGEIKGLVFALGEEGLGIKD